MINNSLIIPCYNEEKNIKRLIELCKKYLNSDENELILVNNGSDDKTEEIIDYYCKIKNIKKVNIPINKGFGNGIVEGAKVSKGNIIIYTHADTEANPEDVLEGLQILKKTNSYEGNFLIKGNRINRRKNNWSYVDIIISSGLSLLISALYKKTIYDLHAQPVIFNKKLINYFNNAPNDFMFDLYIYLLALKLNFQIIRFPVEFNKANRLYGSGSNDTFLKKITGILNHLFKLRPLIKSINKIKKVDY